MTCYIDSNKGAFLCLFLVIKMQKSIISIREDWKPTTKMFCNATLDMKKLCEEHIFTFISLNLSYIYK